MNTTASYKHSYKSPASRLASLAVYNSGYQKCTPSYQWGPGIRDHYLIHHVLAGKGWYRVHGQTYSLMAGDTFLVYPNTEVVYWAHEEDPWEYTWVGFSGNDVLPILENTDFSKRNPVIHQGSISDQIKAEFLNIYGASGNELAHAVDMTGRLYVALSTFMKHSTKDTAPDTMEEYVQKAMTYVSTNYSYPITVDDMANYVGLSRSHLYRVFQKQLGQSPKEYLTSIRLKQATVLLRNTTLSITAIARSVGFEDSLYFSRVFKQATQQAPTIFRLQQTGDSH